MDSDYYKKQNLKYWAERFMLNSHAKHRGTRYEITFINYIGYQLNDEWVYEIHGECSRCGRIEYTKSFPIMRGEKYQPPLEEIV